jgi:shikimate kinase
MNIYLVGFMGTGKSAAGREFARRKNRLENRGLPSNSQSQWQFLDLDELIELKEKRTISDIFAREGEPYFRKREHETLKEVAKEKHFVVACGGGIVINPYNIKIMKDTGTIICLTASPEVILKRTASYSHRPLLNTPDPKKQIGLLLKLRAPYYGSADKAIDTSRLTVEQVVEKIIEATGKIKSKKASPFARVSGDSFPKPWQRRTKVKSATKKLKVKKKK